MSKLKARYIITTVTTTDIDLVDKIDKIRKNTKLTHEDIYRRGIEEYVKELDIK